MKKIFLTIVLSIFISVLIAQTKNDSILIFKAIDDYVGGWYSKDTVRMDKALHSDLVKRRMIEDKEKGGNTFKNITKKNLLDYAKESGKPSPHEDTWIKSEILDIYHDMATAKSTTHHFIDYMHLAKYNGEWKIINVLWDTNYEEKEKIKNKK